MPAQTRAQRKLEGGQMRVERVRQQIVADLARYVEKYKQSKADEERKRVEEQRVVEQDRDGRLKEAIQYAWRKHKAWQVTDPEGVTATIAANANADGGLGGNAGPRPPEAEQAPDDPPSPRTTPASDGENGVGGWSAGQAPGAANNNNNNTAQHHHQRGGGGGGPLPHAARFRTNFAWSQRDHMAWLRRINNVERREVAKVLRPHARGLTYGELRACFRGRVGRKTAGLMGESTFRALLVACFQRRVGRWCIRHEEDGETTTVEEQEEAAEGGGHGGRGMLGAPLAAKPGPSAAGDP